MPSIGDSFSKLQTQLLQNARLVDRTVREGGMDGVHYLPVKDTRELYDVTGDGKADVALVTRQQDTGAWSYDGKTGVIGVTDRKLQKLDAQGRVTDQFDELSVHRKHELITGELRGSEEMTGLVGYIQHVDYLASGSRQITWEAGSARRDAQGEAKIDPERTRSGSKLYP